MKAVLISIQPKWCEIIASGKKTVEVRKTKPKLETPFKCYIYATKPRHYFKISKHLLTSDEILFLVNGKVKMCEGFGVEYEDPDYKHLNCKVIGEFVCDCITPLYNVCYDEWKRLLGGLHRIEKELVGLACLTEKELHCYANGKRCNAWHISDLLIYDKPRELSEFFHACEAPKGTDCSVCVDRRENKCKQVKRPPQSWFYVEEVRQ